MATGLRDLPGTGLSEWVDSQVEYRAPATPLNQSGRITSALTDTLGSEDRTSVLLANTFWQSYVHSRAFRRDLMSFGIDVRAVRKNEILVVAHGDGRFTLLLSDPELVPEQSTSFVVTATGDELFRGWEDSLGRKLEAYPRARRDRRFVELPFLAPRESLLEMSLTQSFAVIVAAPFEEEETHVPSPHVPVSLSVGTSTAGVFVQDAVGRVGVTAALHAVPSGASVTVDGLPGTVLTTDSITDSCFIHVPGIVPRGRTSRGPLKLAPRQHDLATFEGYSTPSGSTRIVAWNYELPYIDPNLQQTVRTDLITAKGDSGAALIDSSDYVVGFAYSRSAPNIAQSNSSWIWADAVLQAHALTIY